MKGIKMLIGALAAASLLFSFSANAQENANRDENGNVVRGAYETNGAFDNIFFNIGAGVNSTLSIKKAPAIGVRGGWHGFWNKGKTAANEMFGFNYVHADVMWNLSNSFGGYKETRFWNIAPYMAFGVLDVSARRNIFAKGAANNLEFAAGPGILNFFRISDRVSITLDLMALVGKAAAYNTDSRYLIMFPSATAGLAFNFGKTNFDRHSSITPVVIPVPFTTEQYNALKDKVAALEKENAALKDKVAALEKELAPLKKLVNGQTYLYENGTFTAVDVTPDAPITLYFNIGSDKLSAREKAHLEYFTQNVVNGDTKLSVNGYADKQTGSAKYNQALSEKRVKTVVDLLKKAGANEANIETAAHGSEVQLFDSAAKNRVVTIEVK